MDTKNFLCYTKYLLLLFLKISCNNLLTNLGVKGLGIIYIISKNYAKIKMNFKYTHMREYQVVVVIVAASIPKTIFRNAAEMRALRLGKFR